MRKTQNNLILCNMLFAVGLVIANVLTSKLVYTGLELWGIPVTVPAACVCYGVTFLMTDVIGEIWGKEEANQTVKFGFLCQIMSTVFVIANLHLPTSDTVMQESMEYVLGTTWVFVVASLCAYFCSQSWDVFIFHKIRDALGATPKLRWVWNNGSTLGSQLIDSVVFVTIAFGFGFGMLFDPAKRKEFFVMLIAQYIVKAIIALLDTPFFYVLTRRHLEDEIEAKRQEEAARG